MTFWPQQELWALPPLRTSFDGNPDRLALFLSQAISHLDQYAQFYPSQWAMIVAVTAVLEGEAAEWVADLHSEHAWEMADAGLFLEALRAHFEDMSRAHRAGELLLLKQRGRPALDYIREFRWVAGRLRGWPERLLVHQFRGGLDRDLRQACVYPGISHRLQGWYQAVIDLDTGLREFCPKRDMGPTYYQASILVAQNEVRGGGLHKKWPGLRHHETTVGQASWGPPACG